MLWLTPRCEETVCFYGFYGYGFCYPSSRGHEASALVSHANDYVYCVSDWWMEMARVGLVPRLRLLVGTRFLGLQQSSLTGVHQGSKPGRTHSTAPQVGWLTYLTFSH